MRKGVKNKMIWILCSIAVLAAATIIFFQIPYSMTRSSFYRALYMFAYKPVRLAYIRTSMFEIPFEGFDSLQDGTGFMKGVTNLSYVQLHIKPTTRADLLITTAQIRAFYTNSSYMLLYMYNKKITIMRR